MASLHKVWGEALCFVLVCALHAHCSAELGLPCADVYERSQSPVLGPVSEVCNGQALPTCTPGGDWGCTG